VLIISNYRGEVWNFSSRPQTFLHANPSLISTTNDQYLVTDQYVTSLVTDQYVTSLVTDQYVTSLVTDQYVTSLVTDQSVTNVVTDQYVTSLVTDQYVTSNDDEIPRSWLIW